MQGLGQPTRSGQAPGAGRRGRSLPAQAEGGVIGTGRAVAEACVTEAALPLGPTARRTPVGKMPGCL